MTIRTLTFGFIALLAAFVLAACQSAPAASVPDAGSQAVSETVSVSSEGYELGNGDRLRVTVFDEPGLSGEFQVDGTGQVSLPLVGEISVVGKSVREFQLEFERQLKEDGFLVNPRVAAEVINFRPYYILGEVARPGEYPYADALTVMNAVATAEGFTYRANRRTVYIRKAGATEEQAVRLTPTLRVDPGDTIRIAERLF